MSVDFMVTELRKDHPRLVYTPQKVEQLRQRIRTDPVISNLYAAIKLNAAEVLKQPQLTRKMIGWRLLATSREFLYRINMLGVVYLVENDSAVLKRIDEEVKTVCGFSDWNPNHFLDTAEMSLGVALALDWTHGALPPETVELAKTALIEKGIKPSWPKNGKKWRWVNTASNQNQVCNGGMIAAAITVAAIEPELAAKTIWRALDRIPRALAGYMPDGAYPEGPMYWGYGTSFTVITAAMLESAFGCDFGISEYPGLQESAIFWALSSASPSGLYYNFADSMDRRKRTGNTTLAWFAAKSGNRNLFDTERFLQDPAEMGRLFRLDAAALAWIMEFQPRSSVELPKTWMGRGKNPVAFFRSNDATGYYFGCKGGSGTVSHGHLDAGSFVFELNGVRWVIDPGTQSYHDLEQAGIKISDKKQNSGRWTLLSKNNFGHSTLTVNGKPFYVKGHAPLTEFKDGDRPEVSVDLTEIYGKNTAGAVRRFVKDSQTSLVIQDTVEVSEHTNMLTWQLMTTAEVERVDGSAILKKDGEVLRLQNRSHPEIPFEIVPLDPPPLEVDKQIKDLKRIELHVPASAAKDGLIKIDVRLTE